MTKSRSVVIEGARKARWHVLSSLAFVAIFHMRTCTLIPTILYDMT
jgi:hypothetical protein